MTTQSLVGILLDAKEDSYMLIHVRNVDKKLPGELIEWSKIIDAEQMHYDRTADDGYADEKAKVMLVLLIKRCAKAKIEFRCIDDAQKYVELRWIVGVGFGQQLYDAFEKQMRRRGVWEINLIYHELKRPGLDAVHYGDSKRRARFFERNGFEKTGVEPVKSNGILIANEVLCKKVLVPLDSTERADQQAQLASSASAGE